MEHAKSELIAFQDSDDIWMTDKLEQQHKYLLENTNVDAVFTDVEYLFQDGRRISAFPYQPPTTLEDALKLFRPMYPQTTVVRKKVFKNLGGYDYKLKNGEDNDFEIRFIKAGYKAHYIEKALVQIRRGSGDNISDRWYAALISGMKITWKHKQLIYRIGGIRFLLKHIAENFCRSGKRLDNFIGLFIYRIGRAIEIVSGTSKLY